MTAPNKISTKFFKSLIISLASCMLFSSICSALEIRVKDRIEIDGDTVYLGDLATFHPADDIRVENFKEVKITAAPDPETIRRINRDLVLHKISRLINSEENINISMPDSIVIKRTGQIIERDAIEKIFHDYVMDNAPWERDQIVIEKINVPPSIALPLGELDFEIDEKQNRNFIGNFSLMIDFLIDGDSLKKLIVSGKISVIRDVVKAARNINRGDIISSGDIMLVSEKRKYFKKGLIMNTRELIGKRATRRIQADQLIQAGMFEVPPAVEKGDRVVIKAENSDLLITAYGKALEEGCVGDPIRVININSGREIIATVRRTDLVEVQF